MNAWYVDSISTTSETFIPFNGAVLSVPKSESVSFYEFDIINIKNDSIPKYDLGLYNQDGIRPESIIVKLYANGEIFILL